MPRFFHALILLCCLGLSPIAGCSAEPENDPAAPKATASRTLTFYGGPRGGTFNHFANKMAAVISADAPGLNVQTKPSGGSVENLLALCSGKADMALVNAGDAFLGRTGKLRCTNKKFADVQAISFLYETPAQLVVRMDSGIHTVLDLRGKTIAVGNPGSGAALSAERFFRHIKLWTSFNHLPTGYAEAAEDFARGEVDGFWILAGHPNASVMEAAAKTPVRILNLHEAAMVSGFYQLYPFYSRATIPAGTYYGQTEPVATFQDAALWCARSGLDGHAVYDGLKAIFSEKRLEELQRVHGAAADMSLLNGIRSLSIPLHPGALRFWAEHKLDIPPILMQ
jgi:hypothetical protein